MFPGMRSPPESAVLREIHMIRRLSARLACSVLAFCLCAPAFAQESKRTLALVPTEGPLKGQKIYNNSHALLIGVNKYPGLPTDRQLDYAVADVDAMKKTLMDSYGWDESRITVLKDEKATKAEILKGLNALTDNITVVREDRLIVYFSGHGQTVALPNGGEVGFIIPHDAKVDLANFTNARPYSESCIKMEEIWDILRLSPAKHILFIADSCYSGLAVKDRSIAISPQALAALTKEAALHAMAAGKRNQVSVELADKGHGAFTYSLLQALRIRAGQPGVPFTINELFDDVQRMVSNLTEGRQTPHFGNYNTDGVFVFIPTGAAATQGGPKQNAGGPKPDVQSVQTKARILVTSDPPGAKIFLNGEEVPGKVTPATIELDLELDKSREVEIGIKLAGHSIGIRKATLIRGQNPVLSIKLDKAIVQPPTQPNSDKPDNAATPANALVRNWKQGSAIRIHGNVKIQHPVVGPMEVDKKSRISITTVTPSGTATHTEVTEDSTVTVGGETTNVPGGESSTQTVDRLGRVQNPPGEENQLWDAETDKLICVVSDPILPGKPVAVGETWIGTARNPATDNAQLSLKGKFLGMENVLGVSAWKINQSGAVNTEPDNSGDNKMVVNLTFWVHPTTGHVLKMEGTLTSVPGNLGIMNWTIKMQALEIT